MVADSARTRVVGAALVASVACGGITRTDRATPAADGSGHEPGFFDANGSGGGRADAATADAGPHDAPSDIALTADAEAPFGTRISERFGFYLELVTDRSGNALVKWNVGDEVDFARWNAQAQEWRWPSSVRLSESSMVDTHSSGHPILVGRPANTDAAGVAKRSVLRFDPQTETWASRQPTELPSTGANLHMTMDGAGNAFAYWTGVKEFTFETSWWPVASAVWQTSTTIARANGLVGFRGAGALLWQEMSGFGVRQFDLATGGWTDEVEIEPLKPSPLHMRAFDAGPAGELLTVKLSREPAELVVDARRYDPRQGGWLPLEAVTKVGVDSSPTSLQGPLRAYADAAYGDFIVFPVPTSADRFDIRVCSRDPKGTVWVDSHVITGMRYQDANFVQDASGNLYGVPAPSLLVNWDASVKGWTHTEVAGGSFKFATLRSGVIAVGMDSSSKLVAYRHTGGGGAWRPARGLGSHVVVEVGTVAFEVAPLGDERALLVWSSPTQGRTIRAAFLE